MKVRYCNIVTYLMELIGWLKTQRKYIVFSEMLNRSLGQDRYFEKKEILLKMIVTH